MHFDRICICRGGFDKLINFNTSQYSKKKKKKIWARRLDNTTIVVLIVLLNAGHMHKWWFLGPARIFDLTNATKLTQLMLINPGHVMIGHSAFYPEVNFRI